MRPPDRPARVYITGFMGSGKSTVGPLLASALGFDFVDLDGEIEAAEGRTIPEIFRERGERDFRLLERRELGLLRMRDGVVVATGGGTLTDPGSLSIVLESGLLVYLEVSGETLIARLRGRKGRPMITDEDGAPLGEAALRARVTALLLSREDSYRRADIIVDAGSQSPEASVSAILRALRSSGRPA